jgi:uncharacterized protein (TIGR04222 family)
MWHSAEVSLNAAQQELFDRLMSFEIDKPGTELTFARRLARENRWSLAYAERVIVEYKKFLFLAATAGHVVSPSEQVDQAWHLHLTYTRSYWDDLCRNVLPQPLHHGPTKGGHVEQAKFVDLYQQTLDSYERLLGHEPPRDIWSPVEQRFGEDLRHVTVNTERYWIIPKPRWPLSLSPATPLFALGIFGLPLAATTWNPLDWNGPEFLLGYVLLTFAAALLGLAIRRAVPQDELADDSPKKLPLDAYEAACLAAGPPRAVQAAFASMVQAGTLRLVTEDSTILGIIPKKTNTIRQGKPLPAGAPELERALFAAVAEPARDLKPLGLAGAPIAAEINDRLIQRGLLQAGPPTVRAALASLVMAAPLLLGVAKIAVGLSRGRPVEILIALCIFTFVAALAFLFARSRLTTAGRVTLDSLQAKHTTSKQLAESSAAKLSPTELAMAIGLFGASMLAVGPLAQVHAMLPRNSGGGDFSAGSYGGGCGGGCGGGGGGGCGGGGCGGCGS